ncbi:MAG: hypothetical protein KBS43_04430 [Oscillospiraceae bacterium]|nr:hypothetical protein [Candidatus Limimonas coprohippi]
MADLFKKNTPAEEAPVVADANAETPAPEAKGKKEKKAKVKYLEPNQMNFLEQYHIVVEGKKKNLDLQKVLKPLIAVAIVVLAIFVLLEVVLLGMKAKNKSLEKYINDEQNVASYSEAVATKEKIDLAKTQKTNMEAAMNAIASYPNVDATFFNSVANTASKNGVAISNYNYVGDNGYLSLTCSAKAVSPADTGVSQFVRDLVALNIFDNVDYRSFNGSTEGGYSFDVGCTFKPDASAPVVNASAEEETTDAPAEEG